MNEPWIQLYNGKAFYPWMPRKEDFDLETIAVSLSRIPRFLGHTKEFYSVAQHSIDCLLSYPFDSQLEGYDAGMEDRIRICKAILFHDAHEAFAFGDIPHPVKVQVGLTGSAAIEVTNRIIDGAIAEWLGIDENLFYTPGVKHVDMIALATEKRDLMLPEAMSWGALPPPREEKIYPKEMQLVAQRFINLANELGVK